MFIVNKNGDAIPASIDAKVHSSLEFSVNVDPSPVARYNHLEPVPSPRLSVYVN